MTALPSLKTLASSSTLRSVWSVLRTVPGGGKLMGSLVGRLAPYTGTIRPEVVELEQGRAKMRLADTRRVRNHLNSVHAVALMNLGEAVSGLAVMFSLPDDARGIVTHLGMDYLKKARGPITAEAVCEIPQSSERKEYTFTAELRDEGGELVAKATAKWLIGPR